MNQEQVAYDWTSRGFSCGLWTDPPGQQWEDFVHKTDEVVIVIEGKMEFEFEGQIYHPKIGEELFILAGSSHSARNIAKKTARWLYGYRQR